MTDPGNCVRQHGELSKKQIPKAISDIEDFCVLLRGNKVKDGKTAFLKLPFVVQCMFLHFSWEIISKKSKYSDDSYLTAFRMFKLFRSKEFKDKPIYKRYMKIKSLEGYYKKALDWSRKSPLAKVKPSTSSGRSSSGPRASTKYDKEYQRRDEPSSEADPLYIFYNTLYQQKPKSPLAITWLTEHGVYDGEERAKLIKRYKKLADKGELIR